MILFSEEELQSITKNFTKILDLEILEEETELLQEEYQKYQEKRREYRKEYIDIAAHKLAYKSNILEAEKNKEDQAIKDTLDHMSAVPNEENYECDVDYQKEKAYYNKNFGELDINKAVGKLIGDIQD